MPPAAWLSEHHAYLQVMLELQARGDVDVIHNNSLHHLPVAMAAACAAPMVTTLHTPPTPWLEPAIEIADDDRSHYVAVSEHTRASWRHVVDAEVVPNGVDVQRWRPGPGGRTLAWAGRLVPEKAPHLAIDIARAAGMRLRLAGPVGDADYVREMVTPPARPRRRVPRAPAHPRAGGALRRQRRHPGHPRLGRALRPGRRRVIGLWHTGRRLRPRRSAGVRDRRRRTGRRPTTSRPPRMPCTTRSRSTATPAATTPCGTARWSGWSTSTCASTTRCGRFGVRRDRLLRAPPGARAPQPAPGRGRRTSTPGRRPELAAGASRLARRLGRGWRVTTTPSPTPARGRHRARGPALGTATARGSERPDGHARRLDRA